MAKKASDGIVCPRTVLDCVLHLQHHGVTPVMQQLEATEPDLAEYLLESLTAVHHRLLDLHGPAAKTRKVYRQVEVLTLVCIDALRRSHAELWLQRVEDSIDTSASDQSGAKPDS